MDMACFPLLILLLLSSPCQSNDQLKQGNPLSPGDLLISEGGDFALGFFSPDASNKSLYIGIWYHNIPEPQRKVIWVANRDSPVTSPSSAKLSVTKNPELVLSDSQGSPLWATKNDAASGGARAFAVLRSTGNFVLQLPNGTEVWQSFDHPTDTILPGMKVLLSSKAQGATRFFAWKDLNDPSIGNLYGGVDPNSNLQFLIWNGTAPYCRTTVFNDITQSSSTYHSNGTSVLYQELVYIGNELYYMYYVSTGSPYTRVTLDYTGKMKLVSWNSNMSSWAVITESPGSHCDTYAACGPFGYCDHTSGGVPTCQCIDGFERVDEHNITRGCQRKEVLECRKGNHFVTLPGMKVPDKFLRISNTSFDQCAYMCNQNCLCVAYAYANISDATGSMIDTSRCLVWTGDLVDMGKSDVEENLYLRLADSPGKQKKKKAQERMMQEYLSSMDGVVDKNIEFPFISFEDIILATDNFSDSNILGKGGFGKVYKGMLEGTNEVAIKRLGKGSGQGTDEFRNEVVLIVKLQHKNLVKLLGCCIHEDERLLIYEYLPNKSLDYFLFDSARKSMLQWTTRSKIIQGVARGIMYLHQDSRLTIIHRDIKASNILLDKEMSPKISDFGMARIFCSDQHQANTNRVVGTYGYMSPEYAMEGAFSVKSDTYSFGVLLLEIVSGLKISSPHRITDFPNLIVYAWNSWKDRKTEDLVDLSVKENCPLDEVSRCIHIGLLCVQDSPDCRPLMAEVVSMLENKTIQLPTPTCPVYFASRDAETGRDGNSRFRLMACGATRTLRRFAPTGCQRSAPTASADRRLRNP
ncbi:hypothetical protein HU200_057684 [Digitaria exilis]|uniref:Receptor-like serine/threonine-protein kinase n=1 Tax=Digitaria exilis TaxID=1010633 RepID=A0A835AAB2_9POAL|nr:hypothetical protein HU200_057684 [Digitaria exilis]